MWRRVGQHAVPVALVVALLLAAPASAQLTPTNNPLPGSNFQGADGNQDDAAPRIDWQALQAAGRVRTSPDPNADDSAFTEGSEETEPGDWGLTTEPGGVTPSKSNIRDAWSVVDQPGADTFLYLGFTREALQGTTFLTFELNHDDRLWNNGRANIPCRRTGDVQISYEPHGDEPVVDVVIRRWTTTHSDAASGCATSGRLVPFSTLRPNVDVQGAMNGTDITSRLPGAITGTVQEGQFGEAALNLAAVLEEAFDERCMAFGSIWMHSRSSDAISSSMQDYVAPRALDVWTCTASGTKFFDRSADGVRNPNDPGIPRFMIWADYDDDGIRDDNEPFSVSDRSGRYVIHDIRPPDGTYRLRERLLRRRSRALPVARDWQCSYPTTTVPNGRFQCAWGPIDVDTDPNVQDLDFGNWFPARLTVTKRLFPSSDPGLFDLSVNGEVVLPGVGDRGSDTLSLAPGTYSVSEQAATGTDLANYRTAVWCRRSTGLGQIRPGTEFTGINLSAGQRATCTFINVRPGVPAIAIAKSGPDVATAGDTLQYTLLVTNLGDVPFLQSAVQVTDPQCNDQPERTSTGDDPSPNILNSGDRWTYRCSRATSSGGDDCEPSRVTNTASVTTGTVEDSSTIDTILLCPDRPNPPIPPTPGPGPGPVVPPGPGPPDAGAAGTAGLIFKQAIQGCIGRRVPRVNLRGVRIASVRIYIDDRLIRNLTLRVLQRGERPRVRTLSPGRQYRIRVRVTFQRGTDSPPVAFTGRIRTCGRPPVACPSAAAAEPSARTACAASSAVVRRWRRPT
jgi:hypothetical protein